MVIFWIFLNLFHLIKGIGDDEKWNIRSGNRDEKLLVGTVIKETRDAMIDVSLISISWKNIEKRNNGLKLR